MSNEIIFEDNKCRGDKCRLNGDEKLQLELLAKQHPGNIAVGVCFERSRLSSCGLKILGEFTPENADELTTMLTQNGDKKIEVNIL